MSARSSFSQKNRHQQQAPVLGLAYGLESLSLVGPKATSSRTPMRHSPYDKKKGRQATKGPRIEDLKWVFSKQMYGVYLTAYFEINLYNETKEELKRMEEIGDGNEDRSYKGKGKKKLINFEECVVQGSIIKVGETTAGETPQDRWRSYDDRIGVPESTSRVFAFLECPHSKAMERELKRFCNEKFEHVYPEYKNTVVVAEECYKYDESTIESIIDWMKEKATNDEDCVLYMNEKKYEGLNIDHKRTPEPDEPPETEDEEDDDDDENYPGDEEDDDDDENLSQRQQPSTSSAERYSKTIQTHPTGKTTAKSLVDFLSNYVKWAKDSPSRSWITTFLLGTNKGTKKKHPHDPQVLYFGKYNKDVHGDWMNENLVKDLVIKAIRFIKEYQVKHTGKRWESGHPRTALTYWYSYIADIDHQEAKNLLKCALGEKTKGC